MKRNGFIDTIKFIFAIIIILYHTKIIGFDFSLISHGYLAVDFFFLVTSYYTAKEALNSHDELYIDAKNHLLKKVKKIIPLFIFCEIFSLVLLSLLNNDNLFKLLSQDLFSFIPLQVLWFSSINATCVMWYISALFIADTIYFILVKKYRKIFSNILAPIIGLCILGLIKVNFGTVNTFGNIMYGSIFDGLARAFSDFFIGGGIIYSLSMWLTNVHKTKVCIAKYVILILMFVLCDGEDIYDYYFVPLAIFMLSCAFAYPTKSNYFTNLLGKLSAILYMIHVQIGRMVNIICHMFLQYTG